MQLQEYISSGIIESYVLGLASEREQAEFEKLCRQYPELQKARMEFELNLEKKALSEAIAPPEFLKEKILENIRTTTAPVIQLEKKPRKTISFTGMKWAIAASVILILACSVFIYIMHRQGEYYREEMAKMEATAEQIGKKTRELEERINSGQGNIKQVKLITGQANIPATVLVFWDSTNTNVYLIVRDLAPLPAGQKYQIWSVQGGKYNSLGLFDAPVNNDKLILKVDNAKEADSFAITIDTLAKDPIRVPEQK